MNNMKILINAVSTKRSAGGGFQITLNFLQATLSDKRMEWLYLVSEDVDKQIGDLFIKQKDKSYFVFPNQPDFSDSYFRIRKKISLIEKKIKPDIVYSITSPSYFAFTTPEVMRFTNGWITNPNAFAYKTLTIKSLFRTKLYSWNQRRLMRKRKYFITQTQSCKEGIQRITTAKEEYICVIPNTLPRYFNLIDFRKKTDRDFYHISCIAAPFPHKNIDIIPNVISCLKNKYGIKNIIFHTTIPFEHTLWKKMDSQLRKNNLTSFVHNHGYCTQEELVKIYSICQIAFIPTLLETFSASLLEAMYFELSIVASDFIFNREITENAAIYFTPTNSEDAAMKLNQIIKDPDTRIFLKENASIRLKKYIDYSNHFNQTLDFFETVYKNNI